MKQYLALALLLPGLATAAPVLERVVIVARHGVRAPTKPPSSLNPYAAQPWPEWPVAPGELTPHGAAGVRRMGVWLRTHYAASGLLPASGCASTEQVFVWADGKDHRTMQSGDAVLAGLAPGCDLRAAHGAEGAADAIFAALETGKCPIGHDEAARISARVQQKLAELPPEYSPALAELRDVLDPAATRKACASDSGICFETATNRLVASGEGAKVKGPLATGASLAEDLSLEYGEGMQGTTLGWGRLDLPALTRIMVLHNLYSGMTRRDPGLAGHNGAYLANAVLTALEAKPVQPSHAPARLTIFLGHDTNLDNLAGIFGLSWQLSGQPDSTPPDGELVFELMRDGTRETVRILARYQSAVQLRDASALTPTDGPGEIVLTPGYCGAEGCTLASLREQAARTIPAECIPHG